MVKKLMRSIREYKKASLLAPIYVACEVILEVLIPYLMAGIIDIGIAESDMNYIYTMGAVLIVAAMASLFCGFMSGRYAAIAAAGFAKNLREDQFRCVQKFSFANIDNFSAASLVTRMTTDVTNVQNAYQMIIRTAVRSPLMLVCAMALSFTVNWRLALIFLVAIPLLGGGLIFIALKAHPYFNKVFRRYDRLNTVVQENVSGARVVKAYVRGNEETEKFKEVSADVYKKFKTAEKIVAFNSPLMQFVMYFCILIISALGAQYIVAGTGFTTGELSSMIVYATQILSSLMMLSLVFVMIIIAQTSAQRIVEVLDEKPDLASPENPVEEVPDGAVEFDNVSFSYVKDKNKCALKNVSFKINSGETVGIMGGTGSAKSTLVSLISRLYDATEGSVRVGGIDVRKYDLEKLRDQVAVVLQKNVLFSGTIKENLRWGDENATDEELVRVCKLAQADDFVSAFPDGYDTYIEQGGTNVSGGQKQRLCIARALLKKPKILILDDSTSAVDTKTDAMIRKALREDLPSMTKFIIAQRVSSVEDADKIIILDNGEIAAFDTPANLLETNEIYREIYFTQKGGAKDE